MNTEILTLSGDLSLSSEDTEKIEKAAGFIKKGGIVAFPTETVYGLGADALDPLAAKKVYEAKGRPSDNPLIVHIARTEALEKIVSDVPPVAGELASAFWPGPLTMVLRKKNIVPRETTGGLDTVAVRMPADEAALMFIERSGGFIAAPSANISGRPSPTRPEHVIEDMSGRIDAIISGGSSDIGVESTIVDLTGDVPEILRPGFVTPEMIEKVAGSVCIDQTIISDSSGMAPRAPGMKYRHYAPNASLSIVKGERQKVAELINERIRQSKGRRVAVMCAGENADLYESVAVKPLTGSKGVADAAKVLYAILRECDEEGVEEIYSENFDDRGLGLALMNRLLKAAGHVVIEV